MDVSGSFRGVSGVRSQRRFRESQTVPGIPGGQRCFSGLSYVLEGFKPLHAVSWAFLGVLGRPRRFSGAIEGIHQGFPGGVLGDFVYCPAIQIYIPSGTKRKKLEFLYKWPNLSSPEFIDFLCFVRKCISEILPLQILAALTFEKGLFLWRFLWKFIIEFNQQF